MELAIKGVDSLDIAINALLVLAACAQCNLHDMPDNYLVAYPEWSTRPIYLLMSAYMLALINNRFELLHLGHYFFDKSIVRDES